MTTSVPTWRLAAASAIAATLLLAACGSDDGDDESTATTAGGATETTAAEAGFDEIVRLAEEEGSVTLYTSQFPDRLAVFEEAFEAAYDIDLTVVRANDSDNIPRIETEHQTGFTADVWVAASETDLIAKAEEGGWFVPAVGPNLDEPAYQRDQNYREGDHFVVGGVPVVLGWNTDLMADGLTDLPDLLDPSLAGGRIGLVEPLAPVQVDLYMWMEDTFGDSFLEDLAAQEPRIYPSTVPMGQALASGEISASPGVLPQEDAAAGGAPVASTLSPEGFWSTPYFGVVLDGAPNPNAAQVLVDFMVSPEGQATVNRGLLGARDDVDGVLAAVADAHQPDNSRLTPDAVAAYQERWRSLFQ
jgi:iron(III) transport system substrate-binding protein